MKTERRKRSVLTPIWYEDISFVSISKPKWSAGRTVNLTQERFLILSGILLEAHKDGVLGGASRFPLNTVSSMTQWVMEMNDSGSKNPAVQDNDLTSLLMTRLMTSVPGCILIGVCCMCNHCLWCNALIFVSLGNYDFIAQKPALTFSSLFT